MKNIITLGAFVFGLTLTQAAFADDAYTNEACCPPAEQPCGEQATGECYCMYVKYVPCYYTTKRCVEECVPCKRKCCRTVPRYYEVQRCRYVPQYYTETCCKNEKEYYYVDEVKTCKKKLSVNNSANMFLNTTGNILAKLQIAQTALSNP